MTCFRGLGRRECPRLDTSFAHLRSSTARQQHYRMDTYNPTDEDTLDLSSSAYTLPLRFKLGDKVMVRISKGPRPDFISTKMNGDGGDWVKAEVLMLHFHQDGWCPGFHCPYMVCIDGDVHDGRREVTPVREDSEAIIRIYEEQQAAGFQDDERWHYQPTLPVARSVSNGEHASTISM